MIQRKTFLKTSDKTNVKWYQTIHLYKGFKRKVTFISLFIKGTVKRIKPPKLEYKGFKRKYLKKGSLVRALIIRTKLKKKLNNHFYYDQYKNSSIIIRKKNVTRSKHFFGMVEKALLRKKFLSLFPRFI